MTLLCEPHVLRRTGAGPHNPRTRYCQIEGKQTAALEQQSARLSADVAAVKSEVLGQSASMNTRLSADVAAVKTDLDAVKAEVLTQPLFLHEAPDALMTNPNIGINN